MTVRRLEKSKIALIGRRLRLWLLKQTDRDDEKKREDDDVVKRSDDELRGPWRRGVGGGGGRCSVDCGRRRYVPLTEKLVYILAKNTTFDFTERVDDHKGKFQITSPQLPAKTVDS
jgi:hypothetical protein